MKWSLTALLCLGFVPHAAADALVELRMDTPPHAPGDAPDVIVHVPDDYDPRTPLHVVVFLHGFSSCARALVADHDAQCAAGRDSAHGFHLAENHAAAHSGTLLVVPQLAFLARDGSAPQLERPGGFDGLIGLAVEKGLANAPGGPRKRGDVERVSVIAHSAGYKAAAAIVQDGARQTTVHDIVLFDALYALTEVFEGYVSGGGRLLSLFTNDRRTRAQNGRLVRELGKTRAQNVREDRAFAALEAGRARVSLVSAPHRALPERYLVPVLHMLAGR